MSAPNRDSASLWDMLQAIQNLQNFLSHTSYEDYCQNLLLQSAVERQLEILGEAARRLSPTLQAQHPEIDWAGLIGLRNIIAHRYDAIRLDLIWETTQTQLDPLKQQLRAILPPT